ncbi:alpha/beta hydrolase-fold protein [Candidatus Riflebacteria bacterium]
MGWLFAFIILFLIFFYSRQILSFLLHPRVDFYITIPDYSPEDSVVTLIGNHPAMGEWKEPGLTLRRLEENVFHASFRVPAGTLLKYKLIRGAWECVEKDRNFNEVANRKVRVQQNIAINNTVANWGDFQGLIIPSTLTGNFKYHKKFTSKHLKNSRDIIVYLPPSYENEKNESVHYPVFYMHDGNNIFDRATSFGGVEWEVDETTEKLIGEERLEEIIVVGIYNTPQRMFEYSPVPYEGYGGGGADLYASFIIKELKPFIDKTYRTKKGREDTAVMGSSMGGLVSLYLGFKYPEVFSKIGAMSSSLWWGDGQIIKFIEQMKKVPELTIWLDIGSEEGGRSGRSKLTTMVRQTRHLRNVLVRKGFKLNKNLFYLEAAGEDHNEAAWSRRVHMPLLHFFGKKKGTKSH